MTLRVSASLAAFLSVIAGSFFAAPATLAQSEPASLRKRALEVFEPLPERMPGAENDTRELIKLGKKLYFDKRLSTDRTISCNTCHKLNNEGNPYASAAVGVSGKLPERDSPTVLNAGLHFAQFWDGRVADLEEQARQPMLNPDEMGMAAEPELVKRLNKSWIYPRRFANAFPSETQPITLTNMAKAIAAYERTLVTRDRFDDFLKGDDAALSRAERKGLETFLDVGCQKCHDGPGLGGGKFEKMGVVHSYANTNDIGRAGITKADSDLFKFKVSVLRNVAMTGPYFHDGETETLASAVRQMAYLQLNRELSRAEVESIEAFLRSLSDKRLVLQRSPTPPGVQELLRTGKSNVPKTGIEN